MPSSLAHSASGRSRLSDALGVAVQVVDVPLLRIGLLGHVLGDQILDHLMAHVVHGLGDVLGLHQLAPLLVDHLALVVHHVVELEQLLADLEVVGLDLLLRLLQRLVDPRVDDRLAFLEAEALQHPVHALGAEPAHQIVLEAEEELRAAGIALAAGAAAQLVVDAPALVALGADDEQAAGVHTRWRSASTSARIACCLRAVAVFLRQLLSDAHVGIAAELDVGAAAGHVGGDGHRAHPPGLGDDVRLLLVVAGVEDLVRHALGLEQVREVLGLLDRDRADQDRLGLGVRGLDLLDDRVVLLARAAVDLVVLVLADHLRDGSGSRPRSAGRSRRTRRPRSRRCRSCRRASCRGGSSSGR